MEAPSTDITQYNLPNELWFVIFDELPPESILTLRAVSCLFKDLASEYYKNALRSDLGLLSLKVIYPPHNTRLQNQTLISCLGPLRDKVRILFLENIDHIGGDWSFLLKKMSQISELILHESFCKRGSSSTLLPPSTSFPNLTQLSQLTALRKLEFLAPNGFTPESLSQLSQISLNTLQSLNFFGCRTLPGNALKVFLETFALPSILNLTIYDLPLVKTSDLQGLSRFTTLTNLSLSSASDLDENINLFITSLFKLRILNISHNPNLCDQALLAVVKVTSLIRLNLSGCSYVTQEAFSNLQHLTGLEELKLNHCSKINDQVLNTLKPLTALRELHLYNCHPITDEGLAQLMPFRWLHTLYIGRLTRITHLGLQILQALPELSDLFLGGCTQLTNLSLNSVKLMPSLKLVNFENCNGISQADFNDFVRSNRRLNILFSKDPPNIEDVQGDGKDT